LVSYAGVIWEAACIILFFLSAAYAIPFAAWAYDPTDPVFWLSVMFPLAPFYG
jgi:hypothetical protein